MNKIKSGFWEFDGDYLRRNYIIGGLWGAIWIRTAIENNEANMFIFASVLYFALCIVLFPFAAYFVGKAWVYPPELQTEAVETVVKQAELMTGSM